MPFAVELSMDDRAAAAIRQVWQSLVQENIPSQPLVSGARPHISLCVYGSIDSSAAAKQLERFTRQIGIIPFELATAETFPGSNGVVFLAPQLSEGYQKFIVSFIRILPIIARQLRSIIYRRIGNRIARSQQACRPRNSNEPSRFVKERLFLFEGSLPRSAY
jgi:hypothetical protein